MIEMSRRLKDQIFELDAELDTIEFDTPEEQAAYWYLIEVCAESPERAYNQVENGDIFISQQTPEEWAREQWTDLGYSDEIQQYFDWEQFAFDAALSGDVDLVEFADEMYVIGVY